MKFRLLALVVAAGLVLTGCVSGTPTPVLSPSPSPVCTPEAGGDEYPCTQEEFEAMKAKDALYAEAEEVNRQLQAILERVLREGAPAEMPEDLLAIVDGSARDELKQTLTGIHEKRITMVGGEMRQVWVRRNLAAKEGSEISLSVCVDSSTVPVFVDGIEVGFGNASLDHLFFRRVDGELKLWATSEERVESCD